MSIFKLFTVTLTAFFLIGSAAKAADLINADDVSYTIFVDLDETSHTITIAPGETISDICRDCYIEIDGNPDGVSIDDEEKVVIQGGVLIIEEEA